MRGRTFKALPDPFGKPARSGDAKIERAIASNFYNRRTCESCIDYLPNSIIFLLLEVRI